MSNETAAPKTIEEKISEKIKENLTTDFSTLVSSEDIKKLCLKAVEDSFFKERTYYNRYGKNNESRPSFFVELVVKSSEQYIKEEIQKIMKEKRSHIEKVIKAYLNNNVISAQIVSSLNCQLNNLVGDFSRQLDEVNQRLLNGNL